MHCNEKKGWLFSFCGSASVFVCNKLNKMGKWGPLFKYPRYCTLLHTEQKKNIGLFALQTSTVLVISSLTVLTWTMLGRKLHTLWRPQFVMTSVETCTGTCTCTYVAIPRNCMSACRSLNCHAGNLSSLLYCRMLYYTCHWASQN